MARAERVVCSGSELLDSGDGVCFEVRWDGKVEPAFAVRYEGRVYAYLNRCGHLPMELDWKRGKFFDISGALLICSTHGAVYEPRTGRCAGGPCNRTGLVPIFVEERDGRIFVKDD